MLETIYNQPVDFGKLADVYPPLKAYISTSSSGHSTVNFQDFNAQRSVTEALLARDFRLSLTLPDGRLCPAIPNRFHYVNWLQKVVKITHQDASPIIGIDIGTGASAIYALLACALEPTWSMIGTEIDELSRIYAQKNITNNKLQNRIRIVPAFPEKSVMEPLNDLGASSIDFVMCNPPFYRDHEEILQSAKLKEFNPFSVCTGADVEMITPGGEVEFVGRMLSESLSSRQRCRWFTSLLGKLSSVQEIVQRLRTREINNYALTELIQGQTRRWVVAWSFGDIRLPDNLGRPSSQSLRHLVPLPNTLRQSYSVDLLSSGEILFTTLTDILEHLEQVQFDHVDGPEEPVINRIRVRALRNSWSRSSRRQREALQPLLLSATTELNAESSAPILVCDVEVAVPAEVGGSYQLVGTWVEGCRRADFESFCSHITRKVTDKLRAMTSRA